jgi:hypothetical protein
MLAKKFIGKPYAGKPHVRFDEGVGKVILSSPLYSTAFLPWWQEKKAPQRHKITKVSQS